jgi:hypothetical protein
MATQTFIFTVLPNGITRKKSLGLSILFSPRLADGATLDQFPDIRNWAHNIQKHGLSFTVTCGSGAATVPVDQSVIRADLWKTLFKPTTLVDPYTPANFSKNLIVSYPARETMSYLKNIYQTVGTDRLPSRGDYDANSLTNFLSPLSSFVRGFSTLHNRIRNKRLEMWNEQNNSGFTTEIPAGASSNASLPADGIPTTLGSVPAADVNDLSTRFALFHHIEPAHNRPPLPNPDGGFDNTLDFHRVMTALASYPSLMRYLGLVFDIEIPLSLCPTSPDGANYLSVNLANVSVGFDWSITPTFYFPPTAYLLDDTNFCAAPAATPDQFAANQFPPEDVVKGLLALSSDNFNLMQVDIDGGMMKIMAFADNLVNVAYNQMYQTSINSSNSTKIEQVLPSLRSAGIGLFARGRAANVLQSISDNTMFNDDLTNSTNPPTRPFNAHDLVRGYRIDVWSSRSKQWHSLHERNAIYKFGSRGKIELTEQDEGFIQLAVAQAADDPDRKPDEFSIANGIPQKATDVHLHERVARWEGWSLSVSRPGLGLNRSADPSKALDPDPTMNQPVTPFKMEASYTVVPHSLPALRFGDNYRLRVRSVDLAGNSVDLNTETDDLFALPANGSLIPYLRFEPVPPPLVVMCAKPADGRTLEYLVIRSHNYDLSLDTALTTETDHRFFAPPRASIKMAEVHGVLDGPDGKLKGGTATYNKLTAADAYKIPTVDGIPLVTSPNLPVKYLPDPMAMGVAFRDLPNTPDNSNGQVDGNKMLYTRLTDVQPRAGSVTHISFGRGKWPDRRSFRLAIAEGTGEPTWNHTSHMLTVHLPKAAVVQVPTSCYLSPADLDIMGVWGWLRELFDVIDLEAIGDSDADFEVPLDGDEIALLTRTVLEGGHEMITPTRTLTLIHAVQQPLGRPGFLQLPVIHRPATPILASDLANSFTPITPWRGINSHDAVLLGALQVNGASSAKIDLEARWVEPVDDTSKPRPSEQQHSQHVDAIDLADLSGTAPIPADATGNRNVALYIPKVDVLWFAAPFDELAGVPTPQHVAAPLHRFEDTKHRWVNYTAVATSRFKEYFPEEGLTFNRQSDSLLLDIPSSARPLAPDIAYVVPVFGWETSETTNVKTQVRVGNALRVYLHRPWFSSGADELLGVVLWSYASPAPDKLTRDTYKALFTQWGLDPIWDNDYLPEVPTTNEFINAVATSTGLSLNETDAAVFDVAGHSVFYDESRRLWFTDIQFAPTESYCPFVRLALARYQPHSSATVELSHVVLADFAQLTPDRSAVFTINPANPRVGRLTVGGLATLQSRIEVSVQEHDKTIPGELGWQPVTTNVTVLEDNPPPAEPSSVLWAGTITLAKRPGRGRYRIVVREYESMPAESPAGGDPVTSSRLVYASIIPFNYP